MYLHASIGIDPSKLTEITRIKPTRIFAKLFYFLTAGLVGEEREVETFTAVAILQQLNVALRKQGVTNIVRLTIDGHDLYLDDQGRPDDIDEAMKQVEVQAHARQDAELTQFERIVLVVEHQLEHLRLLIQAEVDRVHARDAFPILVRVDGLIDDFKATPNETPAALRERMAPTFADQDRFDALLANRSGEFEDFVNALSEAIGEQIHTDEITTTHARRLLRPKRKVRDRAYVRGRFGRDHDDIFFGYYGFEDAFLYAWLWSELSYEHGVHVSAVSLFDERGRAVLDIGGEGFDASSVSTLDPEAPFERPPGEDLTLHTGSDYDHGWSEDSHMPEAIAFNTQTGSWLDNIHEPTSFDPNSGLHACVSCGSCLGD